jgi:hypothetical protein
VGEFRGAPHSCTTRQAASPGLVTSTPDAGLLSADPVLAGQSSISSVQTIHVRGAGRIRICVLCCWNAVPEAGRNLAAKLRSRTWRRAPRRPLIPTDEAVAGTVLAHVAAGRASLFALGAGGAAGSSENGLEESCYQAPRLLIKAESNQKLLHLRRGEGPSPAWRTEAGWPSAWQTAEPQEMLPTIGPLGTWSPAAWPGRILHLADLDPIGVLHLPQAR